MKDSILNSLLFICFLPPRQAWWVSGCSYWLWEAIFSEYLLSCDMFPGQSDRLSLVNIRPRDTLSLLLLVARSGRRGWVLGNGVMNGPVHWMTQTCQQKIVVWKFPDIKYWVPGTGPVCLVLASDQNNNFITSGDCLDHDRHYRKILVLEQDQANSVSRRENQK